MDKQKGPKKGHLGCRGAEAEEAAAANPILVPLQKLSFDTYTICGAPEGAG